MSDVSVAALLDDVRPLIAAAREAGDPRYVLLPPDAFDAVAAMRARDRSIGMPATLLGLEIVRADEPAAPLKVF